MSIIDTTIKEWLSICDSRHTSTCVNTCHKDALDNGSSTRPSRLIDVEKKCIVDGSVEGRYIALSYRWPKYQGTLELRDDNIDILASNGSLEECSPPLPRIIRWAIAQAGNLGEKYLWVDRLCIIQNDPEKYGEIARMNLIYAGAYVTIIAALERGGRSYNIPGDTICPYTGAVYSIHGDTFCPYIGTWRKKRVSDGEISAEGAEMQVNSHYCALYGTEWATRGWTYQENILSRRVVFFTGCRVFWQCECAVWDLDYLRPSQGNEAVIMGSYIREINRQSRPSISPDFELYAEMICPYNGRELSFPEDGLSACLGVLNHLTPAFPDGFLFGMPKLYLDHALLWQPLRGCYEGTHESNLWDGCPERNSMSTRRPALPSWAWCGWRCFIDPKSFQTAFNIGRNGHSENSSANSWRLRSTTTWEYGSSEHISAWTAHSFLLPAATLEISNWPTGLLGAGMPRGFVNPALTEKPLDKMPKVVVLQDQNKKWAGLIRITGDAKAKTSEFMELVVISQGSANGKDLKRCFEEKVFLESRYHGGSGFAAQYDKYGRWDNDSDHREFLSHYKVLAVGEYEDHLVLPGDYQNDLEYEFYNVLWVERGAGDVAYRAGCGRVMKDCWEANNPTQVRITLG